MYYWILKHSKWICPLLALYCRVVSQYQATTGTHRQNIIFFQSKRHCLCPSVSLPVGYRLVWIRACGTYKNILSCRVVSCCAVPYNVNRPSYGQTYTYIKRSPVKIQSPTHWNLIGRRMTVPPPDLSPSSSDTYLSLLFHSRKKKFG
jgi:hypothetical protein